MTDGWTPDQLAQLAAAQEIGIATLRLDGSTRPAVPVWVVVVDDGVYLRTWHRRRTGWFGAALRTRRAWIDVHGATYEVGVEDLGGGERDGAAAKVADDVDAALRAKYGWLGVSDMVTDDARATTLRLTPTQR